MFMIDALELAIGAALTMPTLPVFCLLPTSIHMRKSHYLSEGNLEASLEEN